MAERAPEPGRAAPRPTRRRAAVGLLLAGAAGVVGVAGVAGCASTTPTFPRLAVDPPSPDAGPAATAPAELAPPAGNRVALVLLASGDQVYQCRMTADGYAWVLDGPDARLYDTKDHLVGKHYKGPTWEYQDGSKVTGSVVAKLPSRTAASIDQLLLKAEAHDEAGAFAHVTYVQRLRTFGGLAPKGGCDATRGGATSATQYSADYIFYVPA